MARTIVIGGYGPGISDAVARKFGSEGFQVALVGRNEERLAKGAAALGEKGITAKAFPCDLGDTNAVKKLIADVREGLGPITVLHHNAYAPAAGDLTSCDIEELRTVFSVGVHGLVVAVQEALPDLKSQEGGAVLVTGGGFAFYDDAVDDMIVQYNTMGLGLAKAAQHKLVGVLNKKLAPDGVYVGEVVVLGMVKGTAFDSGQATVEPDAVAGKFWELYEKRDEASVGFGG
jgi:NADP-dependent 3-hydroxy acid dehydrogenase YdfG